MGNVSETAYASIYRACELVTELSIHLTCGYQLLSVKTFITRKIKLCVNQIEIGSDRGVRVRCKKYCAASAWCPCCEPICHGRDGVGGGPGETGEGLQC